MDLTVNEQLAIGNGILTVENADQAWARADVERGDKGGFCRACRTLDDHPPGPSGSLTVAGTTDESTPARDWRPANKRGAARLAAVQALYQMDVAGSGLLEITAEYESHRLGKEVDGNLYREADPQWFRAILSGVVEKSEGGPIRSSARR